MKLEDYYHELPSNRWDTDDEEQYRVALFASQAQEWELINQLITLYAQNHELHEMETAMAAV